MHYSMQIAGFAALVVTGITGSAFAAQTVAEAAAQTAAPDAVPGLTRSIREAVANARAGAADDAGELSVVTSVADVIVFANVQPVQALASVRLAIAEEKCVFEAETWNRWGCAGLSSVASSIQAAIGSAPAATVGTGPIPTPPTPGTPGGAGADYRSPPSV